MKCIPVLELNSMSADPHRLIEKSENTYADQISRAAERIYRERREKPVVLISGPSGSGKTTTAGRLARLLEDNGCCAHTISMDNYFLPLTAEELRLAEEGTRLESGGELLHPSKIRLMRRLIRDKLYRGRSITETMEFFKSVERGEDLYIMPYKHRASFDIDTFIAYEPMVYRDILLDDLHRVSRTYPEYGKYADIEKFLRKLEPLDPANVPDNSLVREFIG